MPEQEHRSQRRSTKEYRVCDAAKNGQLIKLRCNLCRRNAHFLAADLVGIVGANFPALAVPFPCSKCQNSDYIDVRVYTPLEADYGRLAVRRPDRVVTVQTWRFVKLSEIVTNPRDNLPRFALGPDPS